MRTSGGGGMRTSARGRIVVAASRLLRWQGCGGTGIKRIAQEGQATLGSVRHFFPGGKEAVAVAEIRHSAEEFAPLPWKALDGEGGPVEAVMACVRLRAGQPSAGFHRPSVCQPPAVRCQSSGVCGRASVTRRLSPGVCRQPSAGRPNQRSSTGRASGGASSGPRAKRASSSR